MPLSTFIVILLPKFEVKILCKSFILWISLPSIFNILSPICNPAIDAGEFLLMSIIIKSDLSTSVMKSDEKKNRKKGRIKLIKTPATKTTNLWKAFLT